MVLCAAPQETAMLPIIITMAYFAALNIVKFVRVISRTYPDGPSLHHSSTGLERVCPTVGRLPLLL